MREGKGRGQGGKDRQTEMAGVASHWCLQVREMHHWLSSLTPVQAMVDLFPPFAGRNRSIEEGTEMGRGLGAGPRLSEFSLVRGMLVPGRSTLNLH